MAGEWASTTLGDAADVLTGFPFKSEAFTANETDVRLLRGDNVAQGTLRWDGVKRWPISGQDGLDAYHLRAEDVILAMDRPWIEAGLKFAVVRPSDLPCLLVQRVSRLRAKTGVDQRFLAYVIGSSAFTNYILGIQTGTAVPHISVGQIKAFSFELPPLPAQQAIGQLLGSLDEKIDLNRRTAAILEEMARALFKSWFVDFDPVRARVEGRDPGLSPATAALFPDKFGKDGLPEGWAMRKVADGCRAIFSGGTPSTSEPGFWNGTLPWFSSGETRYRFVTDTEKKITQLAVDNSSTRLARRGSTVIASAGQGNTRGQTSLLLLDTHINQSVVALQADASVSSDLFLFFDLERRYDEFRRVSDGQSSRGSLTTKLIGGLPAVHPQRSIVNAFDLAAQPLVDRIESALAQTERLRAVRDTLLPKLVSGELRIKDANSDAEAA